MKKIYFLVAFVLSSSLVQQTFCKLPQKLINLMIEEPSKENLIELAEIAGNSNNKISLEQREELWNYIMRKASNLPNEKDREKLMAMKEKYENDKKNNKELLKSLSMEESEESHRAASKKSSGIQKEQT